MYPSWGNYGGGHPPPTNQLDARSASVRAPPPTGGPFGGYGAAPASNFSSLREQHLQQMQQLQQLHQKQLQSVLHYGGGYGGGQGVWQGQGAPPGYPPPGPDPTTNYQPEPPRGPPGSAPPQPPQPQEEAPPKPPEPIPPTTQQNYSASVSHTSNNENSTPKDSSETTFLQAGENPDVTSMTVQDQQQYWYKQHLQNLQKPKNQKAKQGQGQSQLVDKNQKPGEAPPPPIEPPKNTPPPPPPKEEPPPPPPPEEPKTEIISSGDPFEAARLQQLQAAAAQWQQAQQQRAAHQYQALMHEHAQLQQILQQYQQFIQQPAHLQTMPLDMQLKHYEMQQQQFTPVYQDWDRHFKLWYEQFQSYPHKDQLQDYEAQWKQWQEQMNSTATHLQERVTTLRAMQQQYGPPPGYGDGPPPGYGGMMGQYGQSMPAMPDAQMHHPPMPPHAGMEHSPSVGHSPAGPPPAGPPPAVPPPAGPPPAGPPPAGPPPTGPPPTGPSAGQPPPATTSQGGVSAATTTSTPTSETHQTTGAGNVSDPYGSNNVGPPHPGMRPGPHGPRGPRFDGPRFDQSQQRFNAPPRFDSRQRFNAPPRGPLGRFETPMRHDGPGFERPPGPIPNPPLRFERPPGPSQNAPNRFERPPQHPQNRFERPPGPALRPPGPGQHSPSRFERPPGPGQGPMSRFERPPGPGQGPVSHFERPPGPGQGPMSRFERPPGLGQGPMSRFERPPGLGQGPMSHFERPLGPPPQQAGVGPLGKPNSAAQTKGEQAETTKSQLPPAGSKETTAEDKSAKDKSLVADNLTDDIVDSGNGFFVQSDPIPQTSQKDSQEKTENQVPGATDKDKEADASKTAVSAPSAVTLKQTPTPPGQTTGPAKGNVNSGPPPRPKPHEVPRPPPPGPPHGDNQIGHQPMGRGQHPPGPPYGDHTMGPPPHLARGRGRGQMPMPMRGRGQGGRGRGMPGGPMGPPHGYDPNLQPPEEEEHAGYEYEAPHEHVGHPGEGEEDYGWEDPSARGPPHHEQEIWMPEEHHFGEEYYEETEGQEEAVEEGAEHWGEDTAEPEAEPEYWEQEQEPYWNVRRPPMRGRPPFPHGMRGRPPPPRGFMHQGPRRLPPPHMEGMEHNPYGPPQGFRGPPPPRGPMGPPMLRGPPPRGHPARGMMKPRPPPPREMMERELHGPPPYRDPMEHDTDWPPPPHGREPRRQPPPLPHAMMERDMRRPPPPYGPGPPRRHPPFPHEDPEGVYEEPYEEEYPPPDDGYRRPPPPPPHEFITRDYDHGQEDYYPQPPPPEEWEMERSGRDYPPYPPHPSHPPHPPHGPSEHMRDDRWPEGRERPYPPYEDERGRTDYEGSGYPSELPYGGREPPYRGHPDWEKPLPERTYPRVEPRRPSFETGAEPGMDIPPPPPPAGSEASLEQSSPGAAKGVLALSQRQHEIILKAAQELKLIRELQEGKGETASSGTEVKPELPPGLLGLEIPPEVKSALQSTSLLSESGQAAGAPPPSWDSGYAVPQQPPPSKPIIAKTVDYGHGHETGATVERMSYGERIILRPEPLSERTYEKEPRDPYGPRDPYYDRRNDPYMERREWSRERERDPYRERPIIDHERERFERDRYLRDDRPPPGPPGRPGYRDREREPREREGRGSRDRDPYGRPPYDRPPYERGPERFDHGPPGPPGYGNDRRSYPDERPPGPPPSMAPAPGPPPRAEKKPESKNVDDLLKPPGRSNRPDRIVIIMRGLSGSGKSHVAKLVRDKEVECGGAPPRIFSIDDYFMTEVEKVEKDLESGKNIKKKVLEYEYEPEMEDSYRSGMLKTFKKTLDDGFFPFIIIDAINDKVKYFDQFWSAAKTKGFEVYVAEITADNQTCAKRNIHGRKMKDISKMAGSWEPTPRHMVRLDVRSLLQDAAIEEVEMEDFDPSKEEPKAEMKKKREEEEEADAGYIPKSKWEMDTSEAKLDKLDGLVGGSKRKRESDVAGIEDFLQLPDDYATRMSQPGKKRVRWADLEEQKDADRKRAIGFVVGQTDWEKITDESGQLAQRALNRTKYF